MKTKENLRKGAAEVLPLLETMFGEGIVFHCKDCYRSNEKLVGITMDIPGCPSVAAVYMDDMPMDASAMEIADIAAAVFQDAMRNLPDAQLPLPDMSRENILKNVVLQVLSRKRNRALLKEHPHILCMDLAGIFRLPVGPYAKNSLHTALITNQIAEKARLTVEELAEAAKRNTLDKFGVQFMNARECGICSLLGVPWSPEPFEQIRMDKPGLYTLTNQIHINGAALMLIPEILEQIGEKAGLDYFILPSSIHELLIARDDGLVTVKHWKETVHQMNRNPDIIQAADVLSDSVYRYSCKDKKLKIV